MQAPYPSDTRAKGWRFELDLERIRQSDTWALASLDARPWLLLLWATAWEQTPCGSLPNDDALICARIGMAPRAFAKHRAVLMRGWEQADDGRLYHATITQRVQEMLQRRRKEADRKAASRAGNKPEDPSTPPGVPPLSRGTNAGLHPESDTGTGTGETEDNSGTNVPTLSVAAGKPRGSKRVPKSFELSDDMHAWAAAEAPRANLERELAKFRDHEFAKAHRDWPAAFRNWLRGAQERAPALRPVAGATDPQWRVDQRATVQAFAGRYAKQPTTTTPETIDVPAKRLG